MAAKLRAAHTGLAGDHRGKTREETTVSEPFLGEIRAVSFNFAPPGWVLCDGQTLSIQQYSALFSVLGTTYGGNGVTTFGLPDLRGRVPVHPGNAIMLGGRGGEATLTLTVAEMPAHAHILAGASGKGQTNPAERGLASAAMYTQSTGSTAPMGAATSTTGGSQPHDNMQPYLTVNFIIATQGVFPTRN
jgi:microcystin-dependent protein